MFSQNIPNNLGMMYIWRPVWGKWGLAKTKMSCYRSMCGRCGDSKCSGRPIFIFFYKKKNWICGMTRHHAVSNIIYYWQEIFLLTLASGSEAILYWYHSIVCQLNRTINCVVNLNVTWLGFAFVFISLVHMHERVETVEEMRGERV